MPKTPLELFDYLTSIGISFVTKDHIPLFTVDDGKDIWHDIPGLHCKNLFLKDKKDRIWLYVLPGDKRAELGKLEKALGAARLSFAKPELLFEVLGLTPGSVTPFGLINDAAKRVTVILDEDLMKSDLVNFHPLHNAASTSLSPSDLLRFIKSLGYEPLVLNPSLSLT